MIARASTHATVGTGARRTVKPQCRFRYESATRTACSRERAISGGTDWSTDASGRELMTGELEPLKNPQGQVIGFLAVGLNDSGTASTFTVHALCYTPSS